MIDQRGVAAKACSLLLRYPDAEVLAAVPMIKDAAAELPPRIGALLSAVADDYAATPPTQLAESYVHTFDFRRKCSLHLTYYTHGDTRARGAALVAFSAAYRAAGLSVDGGELPDYLPAVLELAAASGELGWRLLREHRVGVDMLAAALEREQSVYAGVVQALRRLLPPPGPGELDAAAKLAATGPPAEQVGLAPYSFGGSR